MISCPLSTVFLRLGLLPTVQAQVDQVQLWQQLWKRTERRSDYTKAWRCIRDDTACPSLEDGWSRTSGPIGACINVVRQAGWNPIQPDRWIAPGARMAIIAAPEPHGDIDVLIAIKSDLEDIAWKEAAGHFMGKGLEQGKPSLVAHAAAKKLLVKLADEEKKQEAAFDPGPHYLLACSMRLAALDAVVAGGATVGSRYASPVPCRRCGALAETAFHRYFACPANACTELRKLDSAIERTDFSQKSLEENKGEFEECFWARGLIPAQKKHASRQPGRGSAADRVWRLHCSRRQLQGHLY